MRRTLTIHRWSPPASAPQGEGGPLTGTWSLLLHTKWLSKPQRAPHTWGEATLTHSGRQSLSSAARERSALRCDGAILTQASWFSETCVEWFPRPTLSIIHKPVIKMQALPIYAQLQYFGIPVYNFSSIYPGLFLWCLKYPFGFHVLNHRASAQAAAKRDRLCPPEGWKLCLPSWRVEAVFALLKGGSSVCPPEGWKQCSPSWRVEAVFALYPEVKWFGGSH